MRDEQNEIIIHVLRIIIIYMLTWTIIILTRMDKLEFIHFFWCGFCFCVLMLQVEIMCLHMLHCFLLLIYLNASWSKKCRLLYLTYSIMQWRSAYENVGIWIHSFMKSKYSYDGDLLKLVAKNPLFIQINAIFYFKS